MLSPVSVRAVVPKVCDEPLSLWLKANPFGPYAVERKLDGERLLVEVANGQVSYANRHSFNASGDELPKLTKAILKAMRRQDCLLDGELVTGVSNGLYGHDGFLANRSNRDEMTYVAFDILRTGEHIPLASDLRNLPYVARRRLLEGHLQVNEQVRIVESATASSGAEILQVYAKVVAEGGEGVIVKPRASMYANHAWLKLKHSQTADVVVLGVHKSKDSFLIGHTIGNGLYEHYGRVSAYDWPSVKEVALKAITGENRDYYMVTPFIVLEIRHNGVITSERGEHTYRHPRVLRVRLDKRAEDCQGPTSR